MVTPCEMITEQMGLLFTCSLVNQYTRIQTPFLYPDGDVIDIFYKENEDTIILTDLGETLRWLRMQTVTQRRTIKQRQLTADICLNHNIRLDRGMLIGHATSSKDVADAVVKLSQGMLRVSDLWFTFRNAVGESIVDEVADLFQERQINFERSPRISGRSATVWRPDFQTRRKGYSTFIDVLSTASHAATRNLVSRTSTMWHDLSYLTVGQEAVKFVSLFDDTLDVWSQEDIRLVEDISDIVYWSHPDDLLEKIA